MTNSDEKYMRKVQSVVLVYLQHGDDFLFSKRSADKKFAPNKRNGVGGRLEPGEDYLSAAIRETEEETGYKLNTSDFKHCGFIRMEGGYPEDLLMCVFKVEVSSKEIPIGQRTEDGELGWINKEKVLDEENNLVDEVKYFWEHILNNSAVFFASAKLDENQNVEEISIQTMGV